MTVAAYSGFSGIPHFGQDLLASECPAEQVGHEIINGRFNRVDITLPGGDPQNLRLRRVHVSGKADVLIAEVSELQIRASGDLTVAG